MILTTEANMTSGGDYNLVLIGKVPAQRVQVWHRQNAHREQDALAQPTPAKKQPDPSDVLVQTVGLDYCPTRKSLRDVDDSYLGG